MDNLAMWSLIVGTVLPPLVAIIQQPQWSQWLRTVVMVVISIIAGAGTAYFSGELNPEDWVTSTLIVLVAGISTYKGLWAPTGVAPKIEVATSPKAPAPEPFQPEVKVVPASTPAPAKAPAKKTAAKAAPAKKVASKTRTQK